MKRSSPQLIKSKAYKHAELEIIQLMNCFCISRHARWFRNKTMVAMKKICAREAPDKGESLWRGWAQPCGFSVSHVSWWIQTAHPLFDLDFFSSQCLVWKEGGFTNPTGESKDEREGGRREGEKCKLYLIVMLLAIKCRFYFWLCKQKKKMHSVDYISNHTGPQSS